MSTFKKQFRQVGDSDEDVYGHGDQRAGFIGDRDMSVQGTTPDCETTLR